MWKRGLQIQLLEPHYYIKHKVSNMNLKCKDFCISFVMGISTAIQLLFLGNK